MTKSKQLRSRLLAAALVLLAAAAFATFAPTRIGGSVDFVTTHGTSMQPRFHTGDLALVRVGAQYRVGDVVAYHSATLHTVVLHRIIAVRNGRYAFKGDNNTFIDPDHPGRGALIGKLWLRVPDAGLALDWLHTPTITALLTGVVAALLLFVGDGKRRRRRDRRRSDPTRSPQGARPVASPRPPVNARQILAAAAIAALVFVVLAVVAFTRPATGTHTTTTLYSEQVSFDYRAHAPQGPVYRGGRVETGNPVFLRLVHRVRVTAGYRLAASAPHQLGGTLKIVARLTSPTGWTHTVALSPPARFTGDRAAGTAMLDLRRLRSVVDRVEKLTGASPGGGYTLTVVPRVRLSGTLAGRSLATEFAPELSFQVDALQMKPGGAAGSPGAKPAGFTPSRKATVTAPASVSNELGVGGHGLPVATVRWIALAGLLLAAACALLSRLPRLRRPSDPSARIHARYAHLIVPIFGVTPNPGQQTVDVTSIDALAQLADRSERLILHHHHAEADTYLVDDEGTLYRYQTRLAGAQPPPALRTSGDASR